MVMIFADKKNLHIDYKRRLNTDGIWQDILFGRICIRDCDLMF
ncbi:MAG TPA: hypothetical protein VLB50_10055 [Ignavibacteriaceae bacterium]|nr:hypothetical protein [Ignavibacteriaceae bacterium]